MKSSALNLLFPALVSAHGFVQQIWLGNNLVDGEPPPSAFDSRLADRRIAWNPYKDPQKNPPVNKITRIFKDNGPVTDGLFEVGTSSVICRPEGYANKRTRLMRLPATSAGMA
jgi:hypothetical protein